MNTGIFAGERALSLLLEEVSRVESLVALVAKEMDGERALAQRLLLNDLETVRQQHNERERLQQL